jgi:hypothetical protein
MISPAVILGLSFIVFVFSAYKLYGYSKPGVTKGMGYYLTVFMCFASFIGMAVAGFMLKKGAASGGSQAAVEEAIQGTGELLPPVVVAELTGPDATSQSVYALKEEVTSTAAALDATLKGELTKKVAALDRIVPMVEALTAGRANVETILASGKPATAANAPA